MRIHINHNPDNNQSKLAVYTASNGAFTAIALATGSDGAETAVQSTCSLLLRLGANAFDYPAHKTAQLLADEVYFYAELDAMARRIKIKQLGADLAACIVSADGRARLFQLGSCAPFLTQKGFGLRSLALSQPDLRTRANTVSEKAGTAMAVSDRVLKPHQGILLCADGLWELLRGSNPMLEAIRREDAGALRAGAGNCGYIWLLPDMVEAAHD